ITAALLGRGEGWRSVAWEIFAESGLLDSGVQFTISDAGHAAAHAVRSVPPRTLLSFDFAHPVQSSIAVALSPPEQAEFVSGFDVEIRKLSIVPRMRHLGARAHLEPSCDVDGSGVHTSPMGECDQSLER